MAIEGIFRDEIEIRQIDKFFAFEMGRQIHREARALIKRLGTAFGLVHSLRRFGWTDVTSLDDAKEYLLGMETESV